MSVKSPDPIDIEVGRRIRGERLAKGLSQTALAMQLGVTFQQVQKYEKGVNRVGAGRLTRIAQVLGVPMSSIIPGPIAAKHAPATSRVVEALAIPHASDLLGYFAELSRGDRRLIVELAHTLSLKMSAARAHAA